MSEVTDDQMSLKAILTPSPSALQNPKKLCGWRVEGEENVAFRLWVSLIRELSVFVFISKQKKCTFTGRETQL